MSPEKNFGGGVDGPEEPCIMRISVEGHTLNHDGEREKSFRFALDRQTGSRIIVCLGRARTRLIAL